MIRIIKVGDDEHNKDGEVIEFHNWSQIHGEFGEFSNGYCVHEHCTHMCHEMECDCIVECAEHAMEVEGWKEFKE